MQFDYLNYLCIRIIRELYCRRFSNPTFLILINCCYFVIFLLLEKFFLFNTMRLYFLALLNIISIEIHSAFV